MKIRRLFERNGDKCNYNLIIDNCATRIVTICAKSSLKISKCAGCWRETVTEKCEAVLARLPVNTTEQTTHYSLPLLNWWLLREMMILNKNVPVSCKQHIIPCTTLILQRRLARCPAIVLTYRAPCDAPKHTQIWVRIVNS